MGSLGGAVHVRGLASEGASGFVDIPSNYLYVCTVPMYGYMDRRYRFTPFSSHA